VDFLRFSAETFCNDLVNLSQLEEFGILTAEVSNVAIVWNIYHRIVLMRTDGSEERITTILRFENRQSKKSAVDDYPEVVGYTFLRNVGSHTDYTAIYPTRWQHSYLSILQYISVSVSTPVKK
jgi:hypothetical protein